MRRKGLGVRARTDTEIVTESSASYPLPFTPYKVLWV